MPDLSRGEPYQLSQLDRALVAKVASHPDPEARARVKTIHQDRLAEAVLRRAGLLRELVATERAILLRVAALEVLQGLSLIHI